MSTDQKMVRRIRVEGPEFHNARVKSVDADKGTVTFEEEGPPELVGKTFQVAKGATIRIDGKESSQLADVPQEAVVDVTLSVDQKTVRRISAQGPQAVGVVKAINPKMGTITFNELSHALVGGKIFPVARDATIRMDGKVLDKLADLPSGTRVNVVLSADQKTVLHIDAQGPVSGVLQSVDAERLILTVALKEGETTFSVDKDATVEIDGQPATLAGLSKGTFVTLSKFAAKNTVSSIQAKSK